MEAAAVSNFGRTALGSLGRDSLPSTSSRAANRPRASLGFSRVGAGFRTGVLAERYEDESHVQFYLKARCMKREDAGRRSARAVAKGLGGCEDVLSSLRDRKERKKRAKVMRRGHSSSSSSSESESSSSDIDVPTMTEDQTFRPPLRAEFLKKKKFNMEEFRREWEELSRSDLFNSLPRITPDFKIEPPLTETMERLQKTFDLPSARPPPAMVRNPAAPAEAQSRILTHSLATVAGVAVVEHLEEMSETELAGASAHIEVCMGGKCKKAGAAEVLRAFDVAGRPGVTASACKCMKNCKSAVSVRIGESAGAGQLYTGVGVQDVDVLLQRHCSRVHRAEGEVGME